jgi:hypothetical protein
MMMKKYIAILMVLAFAGISQGQTVVDAWYYTGVSDGALLNTAGCGSVSNATLYWKHNGTPAVVSNQMQRWEGDYVAGVTENGSAFKNITPSSSAGASSGAFEFSWELVSADFSNTAANDGRASLGYYIRGAGSGNAHDTGIRVNYQGQLNVTNVVDFGSGPVTNIYADADQIQLMVRTGELSGWSVATNFTGSSVANLGLFTRVDINAGTADLWFELGGVSNHLHSGTLEPGFVLAKERQHIQSGNGGNSWQPGDVVTVDNIVLTQLAEALPPPQFGVIDVWHYHDNLATTNLPLSQGVSTGMVGGVAFSNADIASITNNMLLFQHTSLASSQDSLFRVATPSAYASASTGIYELAWDYVAADFALTDAANSNANVGITVRDKVHGNVSMGFRVQYHGADNEFRLQMDDANGNNQTMATFAGNTLSNLSVRLVMDLDNSGVTNSAALLYSLNGDTEVGATYNGKVHANFELTEYRMIVQTINGGTGWQIGDTVWTDNLKFEKVVAMPVPPPFFDIAIYEMNDTAGTLLNALAQTGPDGGQLNGTDASIATDGLGSLVSSGAGTNDIFRTHTLDVVYTSGLHRLEFAFDDFNLDASEDTSSLRFGFGDDTGTNSVVFGIDVNTNNAAARFRASANNGGGAGQDFYDYGYVASTGVVLRLDVNLDSGSFNAKWRYDNGTEEDFIAVATGKSLGLLSNIAQIKLSLNAGDTTGFDAADYINVDFLRYKTTSTQLPPSPTELWNAWLALYPGLGTSTNFSDDFDGDTLENLLEYAHGGSPVDGGDLGNLPSVGATSNIGGTNYIDYVFIRRRLDDGDRGLSYTVRVNDDLVFGTWTNDSSLITFVGGENLDESWRAVTNRVNAEAAQRFIKTDVKFTP